MQQLKTYKNLELLYIFHIWETGLVLTYLQAASKPPTLDA
jgi:hypothetical protein